jgi:hypothetical protein
MLMTATFALGIWADRAHNRYNLCMQRVEHYREEAAAHLSRIDNLNRRIGEAEKRNRQTADRGSSQDGPHVDTEEWRRLREESQSLAAQCEAMRASFRRAALIPFIPLPVEPDLGSPFGCTYFDILELTKLNDSRNGTTRLELPSVDPTLLIPMPYAPPPPSTSR